MAEPSGGIHFETEFEPETGQPVTVAPGIVRVTAPNASPYTFTGTNSFLVGDTDLAVIDPGPDDDAHLGALIKAIDGREVKAVLLTHTHLDHSRLAPRLSEATGAPLWFGGRHRLSRPLFEGETNPLQEACDWGLVPDRSLGDGDVLDFGPIRLQVIATPGHCANHLCFGVAGTATVLTGDHVMGWSSTLVSPPDGSMRDYYASLDRLAESPFSHYLPAHGGPIAEGKAYTKALKIRRQQRDAQVLAAVSGGARSIEDLLARIYPDIAENVQLAAMMTLKAHVEYLEERGALRVDRSGDAIRLAPQD